MKTVVAVIVYNRLRNIQEWAKCWKQSVTDDAELVVIHNYRHDQDKRIYESFCRNQGITYISRKNIGFDIGAFQDVCRGRLEGFPQDFDYLLWCTDDLWPMKKDFLPRYLTAFTEGVASVCYEISQEIHPHIRTTGFMLQKDILPKIAFKADPVITKSDCYDFEHRDKVNSLMDQMKRLGKVVQVEGIETSCMWDTHLNSREARRRKLRRQMEHKKAFG